MNPAPSLYLKFLGTGVRAKGLSLSDINEGEGAG